VFEPHRRTESEEKDDQDFSITPQYDDDAMDIDQNSDWSADLGENFNQNRLDELSEDLLEGPRYSIPTSRYKADVGMPANDELLTYFFFFFLEI
jgi:hypothetical protein